jgi:hypothetical protein
MMGQLTFIPLCLPLRNASAQSRLHINILPPLHSLYNVA